MAEINAFPGLLASKEEYTLFWKHIHDADVKDTASVGSTTSESFWRKVEAALNRNCRELFVEGMPGEIHVVIDDDKLWYHVARMMLAHEPKAVQHVRDNARGFVIDTAVYNASSVPVGFSAQGRNDSTASSTKRLIRSTFAPGDGGNEPRCLTNVHGWFDRGYVDWEFNKTSVEMGMTLNACTVRRAEWTPLTYDQKLKPGDPRIVIPKKGPKTLYQQTYKAPQSNVEMNFFGYRNGNGGVTLLLSNCHSGLQWDFVLQNPNDRIWYTSTDENMRKRKWFQQISGGLQDTPSIP